LLPLRSGIAEKVRGADTNGYSEVELKLQSIIGRKAHNRRNNLFYDYDERLIYVAGCNLVITTLEEEEEEVDDEWALAAQIRRFKGGTQPGEGESVHQEFIKMD
jgi:hypothetical protein